MRTVLIIEKPNQCIECPCYRQMHEDGKEKLLLEWCSATNKPMTWQEVAEVPKWCPLKPLPEAKETYTTDRAKEYWMACGWNECLEEIEDD